MANYKIYPKVKIGKDTQIGDFVIIGLLPEGREEEELETTIGDNAHIRSHTVIYAGNTIGNRFVTGHAVLIRESNTIGNGVSIGSHSVVEHRTKIGNGVRIHSQAFIPEYSTLEDNCWVGPNVVFTNALHPLCPKVKECLKGPVIKKGAKIGANATLLPGITVGEGSLVGAGSVVVDDVGEHSVVAGNPARKVKKVDQLKCPFGLIEKPY